MSDNPRDWLRNGDTFAKAGNPTAAVSEYVAYATWADAEGFALKAAAVYKQVLVLAPTRRDVRRRLAESFVVLGLVNEAVGDLAVVAAEAKAAGDDHGWAEALARRDALESR